MKIPGLGATPIAVSTQLPAAVAQLVSQQGECLAGLCFPRFCFSFYLFIVFVLNNKTKQRNQRTQHKIFPNSPQTIFLPLFFSLNSIIQGHQIPGRPSGGRHGMVFGHVQPVIAPTIGNKSQIPLVPGEAPYKKQKKNH